MKRLGTSVTLIFVLLACKAQTTLHDQGFLFSPHYALQIPHGDLKDRYDLFSSIGLAVEYKTKRDFIFGIDYDWYFGESIGEFGTFSEITTDFGQIIDADGNYSVVRLNIKGNYLTANCGYLINLPKDEPNSGILIQLGAGWMQHKIDIIASQTKIPQINGEYEKGYDKLTYGFATKQFIGYQHLNERDRYHLRAGIEFNQGFTQGRRTWDFNANAPGTDRRFDGTTALQISFIVPVYTKDVEDEEFFID